jgi:hypothetical protein
MLTTPLTLILLRMWNLVFVMMKIAQAIKTGVGLVARAALVTQTCMIPLTMLVWA